MGKMKELFMEIRQRYDDEIPDDFSLRDYLYVKKMENEEWQRKEEEFTRKENNKNDAKLDDSGGSN